MLLFCHVFPLFGHFCRPYFALVLVLIVVLDPGAVAASHDDFATLVKLAMATPSETLPRSHVVDIIASSLVKFNAEEERWS